VFHLCEHCIRFRGWHPFGRHTLQLPTSHSQRLNSGKPLGTGRCEWLWSIATWANGTLPIQKANGQSVCTHWHLIRIDNSKYQELGFSAEMNIFLIFSNLFLFTEDLNSIYVVHFVNKTSTRSSILLIYMAPLILSVRRKFGNLRQIVYVKNLIQFNHFFIKERPQKMLVFFYLWFWNQTLCQIIAHDETLRGS